jgi:glucokinase-like ROK family protein
MFAPKSSNKVIPADIKRHNEELILRTVYAHQSISRVRLAALTNLSRPSVTELTQGLIKYGLVVEVGPEQVADKVGKKPTLLAFNPEAFHLITIVLSDTEIIGTLCNLRMRAIEMECTPLSGVSGVKVTELILGVIEQLTKKATRPLLGISVGTPGIVDSHKGIVHLATNLGWQDLALAEIIAERFKIPVYIGNDSNLAAVGEYRFGRGQGIQNLIVVKVGTGIGAGIVVDGKIIEGDAFGAGEMGHIPFPNLDTQCICGRRGCLESMVSLWGITQEARHRAAAHPDSLLNTLAENGDITIETVLEAVKQGDSVTIQLVKTTGAYLGQALISVIGLLNPKEIILTGSMVRLGDIFLDEVRRTVEERAFAHIARHTSVSLTSLGDDAILLGAGAVLLEKELSL